LGKITSHGKQGVFIEGRQSNFHQHKNGSYGRDIYAAKVTYKNDEKVAESNAGWGKVHTYDAHDRDYD